MSLSFKINQKAKSNLGRAGILTTPHGDIETPALIVAATKGTVKSLTPEMVSSLGAQAVLANTYHLYLQPGDNLVAKAGGLHKFMNWDGPIFTDSGGFQAFSLGEALGKGISKLSTGDNSPAKEETEEILKLKAKIDEDGVTFKSFIDGSTHRFTPERSVEIQHNLGADIIFAFDECPSPTASYEYQKEAMERTHRWAKRSLDAHAKLANFRSFTLKGSDADENVATFAPAIFGIVQGGRYQDLREESAKFISSLNFEGFGIGGSFDAQDMATAVRWVTTILPEDKPRHLLGIGENPHDFFLGVEAGIDTFDCVAPTRMARNGTLDTSTGRINILNACFRDDLAPIDSNCSCYTCTNYTRSYVAHLFRAKEMLAATLASIHNLYFAVNLVKNIRQSILDGTYEEFKSKFLARYLTEE